LRDYGASARLSGESSFPQSIPVSKWRVQRESYPSCVTAQQIKEEEKEA
jgi:hypothetical protein